MSYSSRPPLPSHLRQASTTSGNLTGSAAGQSPILLARINEKKAELENLKQLRDLSAGLAGQMQMLEEKLATLSDGTEGKSTITVSDQKALGSLISIAVATVLGNWHNVLRAISMASSKFQLNPFSRPKLIQPVKIPKAKDGEEGEDTKNKEDTELALPQTLVRIPTEHAPMLQQQASSGGGGNID
jgi:DASH complex subunit DAD2